VSAATGRGSPWGACHNQAWTGQPRVWLGRRARPVSHRIRAVPQSGRGMEGAASDLRSPVGGGSVNWKLCNLQQYCKSMHTQFHA